MALETWRCGLVTNMNLRKIDVFCSGETAIPCGTHHLGERRLWKRLVQWRWARFQLEVEAENVTFRSCTLHGILDVTREIVHPANYHSLP